MKLLLTFPAFILLTFSLGTLSQAATPLVSISNAIVSGVIVGDNARRGPAYLLGNEGIVLGGNLDPNVASNYTLDPTAAGVSSFGQDTAWTARGTAAAQWVILDLGSDTKLSSMNLFQFATFNGNNSNRGTNGFDVYLATDVDVLTAGSGTSQIIGMNVGTTASPNNATDFDSTGFTLFGTGFTLAETSGTGIQSPLNVDLSNATARYIAIDILSNHGSGEDVGLSEIQVFALVPEPSQGLLILATLAAFGARRRRSRQP